MPLKIIISGAGIGGLAAAGYLRAHHEVTVLERGELDFSINDYGLSITSNAFGLLQKAGINIDALEMILLTHIWVINHKRETVATLDFAARAAENGFKGVPSVVAKRAKLQKELLRFATSDEFAGKPAQIITGAKVERVDVHAGKVTTQDGREFHGDLVVGADGIASMTRKSMMMEQGLRAPPSKHDLLAFVTTVPKSAIEGKPELENLLYRVDGGGFVIYRGSDPSNPKKRVMGYNTSPTEIQIVAYSYENEFADEFNAKSIGIIKNVSAERALKDFEAEFSPSVCSLLTHGQIDAWRIRDISPPLEKWTMGKTILVGDAAHALTPHAGQGCNLTIEDAEALAYLLKDVGSSTEEVQSAFKNFEELRKDRAEFVARHSRQLGNVETEYDKAKGVITNAEFTQRIYGYHGVEAALKQAATSA